MMDDHTAPHAGSGGAGVGVRGKEIEASPGQRGDAMFRFSTVLLGTFALVNAAPAAVQTKTIAYKHGDLACQGFLAWDDAVAGPRPGVLVVHEWWGLNDYARNRARQLAKLGYVAFAADLYGEGKVTDHPQQAGEMANTVRTNVQDWRRRAATALKVLTDQPQCDKTKLAAIGYCFGGSTCLQLAYSGADALPTPTPAEAKQIKATLLVCHGADDRFVSEQAVKAFRAALDQAGVKYEFVAYPGVVHSFTVPGADKHNIPGMKYDKSADEDSWKRLTALLADKLK
jgi:dienelactone hydrolase